MKGLSQKRQPLTAAFRGSEHLGAYGGHGKGSGAVCDPKAFDGVVIVSLGYWGRSTAQSHSISWNPGMCRSLTPVSLRDKSFCEALAHR